MMNIYMIPIKENIDAWHHRETRAGYRTDIIGIDTSDAPGCWNIYLQNWVIFRANVGKYASTMEHMGIICEKNKIYTLPKYIQDKCMSKHIPPFQAGQVRHRFQPF